MDRFLIFVGGLAIGALIIATTAYIDITYPSDALRASICREEKGPSHETK